MLPPPNMPATPPPSPRGRRGPTRGVVIGTLVAVAVVAAAVVAVTIVADDDSTSEPPDDSTTLTGRSTAVRPTTTSAADLPTAAAAARIDEVVEESGVGDDGVYSIEDQECPFADATVRRIVDSMLALGDGELYADGAVATTVRDIRFDGPTYEVECTMEIGEGADDALVSVSNTPQEYRRAFEMLLDAEAGPQFAGGTIMRTCSSPTEENGCGVGWLDGEIAVAIGVESELAVGMEPGEIESLLVAELPGLVNELAG